MVKNSYKETETGIEIMAINNTLIDAVARFTDTDVDKFRNEWNSQIDSNETNTEKQEAFNKAKKTVTNKNLLVGGLSSKATINYISLSGEEKERNIIIRRIFKSGKNFMIDALCLDINAPRLIKSQNIQKLIDIQSNKTYTDILSFFDEVLEMDVPGDKNAKQEDTHSKNVSEYSFNSSLKHGELKTAINRTRHEITALLFVSCLDGEKHIDEMQKVVDYVRWRCPDLTIDNQELMHYLENNCPDVQSFYFSLERILGKEGWIVKMFLEKLMELIVSDGNTADKEKLFLADFIRILEEEGFVLNFKTN